MDKRSVEELRSKALEMDRDELAACVLGCLEVIEKLIEQKVAAERDKKYAEDRLADIYRRL